VIFKGIELCCPHCKGDLQETGSPEKELQCLACGRHFPILLGIPDLRVFPDPYYDFDKDRANGLELFERCAGLDFERAVDVYYSQAKVTPSQAQQFKRGLMAGAARAAAALSQWEAETDKHQPSESLLEVGCGTAQLLSVAARRCRQVVGIDIALRWLVIAQRHLADVGLDLPLICACAEALPFPDGSFDRVVADSVLEHLRDQPTALAESYRVMRPAGYLFVSTPNRLSLGPDPHVGLWGGGFMPQRWIDGYVRRQGGNPPIRQLLSYQNLDHLIRAAGFAAPQIYPPDVPAAQSAHLSPALKRMVELYHLAKRLPASRQLLNLIGPILHVVSQKSGVYSSRVTASPIAVVAVQQQTR
jgi:ubiquinone/menaquinone biosynthesis C-methylase UbiE/uncharacterized protein YbaR (Trm112 family)